MDNIDQKINLAIQTHIHDGNFSERIEALDIDSNYIYLLIRVVAATTDNTVATVVGGDYVMPYSGTIYDVGATVDTAGVTGTTQIDINRAGTTIMAATKITIDSAEKTSRTGVTLPIISAPNFNLGDIFTFDVDTIQTTAAKGLTIFMVINRSI